MSGPSGSQFEAGGILSIFRAVQRLNWGHAVSSILVSMAGLRSASVKATCPVWTFRQCGDGRLRGVCSEDAVSV
jgi:hypothetical protein